MGGLSRFEVSEGDFQIFFDHLPMHLHAHIFGKLKLFQNFLGNHAAKFVCNFKLEDFEASDFC